MSDDVVQNPHDRFFRTAFGKPERARALLQGILPPEIADGLAWSTLRLEPGSYLDEHLRERVTDLLYSVKGETTDVLVYCLIEHQSTPDRWMPLRQLSYQMRIWEDFRTRNPRAAQVPAIIPVVLYQGDAPWNQPMDLASLVATPEAGGAAFAKWIPRFEFIFLPLQSADLEKIAADLSVRLILRFMREIVSKPDTRRVQQCFAVLAELCESESDAQFIRTCRTCLFDRSGEVDTGFFEKQIEGSSFGTLKEDIMTLAEQYIEKGRQEGKIEGKLEGKAEGKLEGKVEDVIEVLVARFGPLPADISAAVTATNDLTQLQALLRTAVRCSDLNALRATLSFPRGPEH